MSNTPEIHLRVGYAGKTYNGKSVYILSSNGPDHAPYQGDNGEDYFEDGECAESSNHANDIISELEE